MKNKLTKTLNIIVDVLVVLILVISVLILTMVLSSRSEGVPNVLGKAPVTVLTNSMDGDKPENFKAGDLLICDVRDVTKAEKFKVGDIVTFKKDINNDDEDDYVTHRIYKVNENGTYQTKGDNNSTYDQDPDGNAWGSVAASQIVATYHGTKISGLGKVLDYLQTGMGFFLVILLPMIIFFLYQGVRVVINVIAYNKEKAMAKAQEAIANSDLTDEQKQKAIEEYLAAQKAKEAGADSAEAPEEKPEETPAAEAEETPAEEPAETEPEAKE